MQRPWGIKDAGLFEEPGEGQFGWRTDERGRPGRGQKALKAVQRPGVYPGGSGKPREGVQGFS